jgi:glycosyltransferase involved in cell wall biosynthesis
MVEQNVGTSSASFKRNSISMIFPAFNEESNIEQAVEKASKTLYEYFKKVEIIVVNDGSGDQTPELIDKMAARSNHVVAIHHTENKGYGATLRSGFYKAKHELIFFSDSDLQFDIAEIQNFLKFIDNYDIITGYRAKRADNFVRKLNAWGWNKLVRLVLGVKIRDIDCAFKIFHRRVFDTIELSSVGAMINTEIFYLAKKHNMRVYEMPVNHYPRLNGEQSGADIQVIIKAFRELFNMYKRKI